MPISLRSYNPGDDFDEVFSFAREILAESPVEDARRELLAYPAKALVAKVALDSQGTIIGFGAATYPYWNNIAIIDYLVVKPEWRSRGVGAELIAELERALSQVEHQPSITRAVSQTECAPNRMLGIRIVTVQTVTWNEAGIRFYERQGYTQRVVLPSYYGADNDLVWLDRTLES
ncbi:MAG: GNAT family N-acetyltransferase [Candidatus Delongbacteria bacterium]|nr:GNAT family N-acetyltransferase [Candidatus Delongbacteria bacterium]